MTLEFNFKEIIRTANLSDEARQTLETERVDNEKAFSLLNTGRIAGLDLKIGDAMLLEAVCRERWPGNFAESAPFIKQEEGASSSLTGEKPDVRPKTPTEPSGESDRTTTKSLRSDPELDRMVKQFMGISRLPKRP